MILKSLFSLRSKLKDFFAEKIALTTDNYPTLENASLPQK